MGDWSERERICLVGKASIDGLVPSSQEFDCGCPETEEKPS
jgi:hypothetical protein